jgi:hypothetical protein
MQKKIDRMPKKAFLPGHLTGEATLPPLGRTGRCEARRSFAMIFMRARGRNRRAPRALLETLYARQCTSG